MAKVVGPLFSMAASGKFRESMVFRTRQLGSHVMKMPTKQKIRTSAQNSHSANISDMAKSWKLQSQVTKTAWSARAVVEAVTGYQLWWREWIFQGSSPGNLPTIPV